MGLMFGCRCRLWRWFDFLIAVVDWWCWCCGAVCRGRLQESRRPIRVNEVRCAHDERRPAEETRSVASRTACVSQLLQYATVESHKLNIKFVSNIEINRLSRSPDIYRIFRGSDGHIEKSSLIAACSVCGILIVSCAGSAGRSHPTLIRVDDLSRVSDGRLIFQCKKRLGDYY
jgi:hypothetical protein